MEWLLFWWLFGILCGVAAAQRRGFSTGAGALGGLVLGPLALLMFFVSGVSRGDATKVCPNCAERIKAAAVVCRYCGRPA